VATLRDEAFLDGQVSTDFFDRRAVVESTEPMPPDEHVLFAAAVALAEHDRVGRRVQAGVPVAWRNVVSQPQRTTFAVGEEEHPVDWYGGRDGYRSTDPAVRVLAASPEEVVLEVGGVSVRYSVAATRGHKSGAPSGTTTFVTVDGGLVSASLREVPRFVDPADAVASGSLLAPMPGSVVRVAVEEGDRVAAGEPVLVLEAMKMQHTISAPSDGVVSDLVAVGDQVAAGDVLAVVSESEDA